MKRIKNEKRRRLKQRLLKEQRGLCGRCPQEIFIYRENKLCGVTECATLYTLSKTKLLLCRDCAEEMSREHQLNLPIELRRYNAGAYPQEHPNAVLKSE